LQPGIEEGPEVGRVRKKRGQAQMNIAHREWRVEGVLQLRRPSKRHEDSRLAVGGVGMAKKAAS
jgi:hypothetical protein